MQSDNQRQQAIRKHASKRQTETRKQTTSKQRVTNEHKRARSVTWVESGRGQMPFKERQCREKTVSLWLKRTKHFFTVTKNQDFGLFPKGIGNFHSKWYIACFYISIHWIPGSKLWGFPSGISNLHSIPSLHWRFVLFTRVGNWHSSPKSFHSKTIGKQFFRQPVK